MIIFNIIFMRQSLKKNQHKDWFTFQ